MFVFQRLHIVLIMVVILAGCGSLPAEMVHPVEPNLSPPTSTLSQLIETYELEQQSQGESAVLIQNSGWDALSQRLALIESAERSIDIQYYIWNSDVSGNYLANRLVAAADRGVKVRVMLDDINLNEREGMLVALDSHPQIEIRIFNPIPSRRGVTKWLSLLGDLPRLNRRMHNKSFTVDGVLSVVGGRNIGDEYFDLSDEINFRDRDALVMGSVVTDVQASFVNYWDCRWSYPVDLLGDESASVPTSSTEVPNPIYKNYPALPEGKKVGLQFLKNLMDEMVWVRASFVSDRPVPLNTNNTDEPKETAKSLAKLASQSEQEVLLESAYLIFDDRQLDQLHMLTSKGIQVKALTNSMASNDLITNHSGYAGRREDMLENGVQLFELKPETKLCEASTKDTLKCAPTTAYGLHAKSSVYDRQIAVIGSFNFNLRSTYLNTESVLVIENPLVAENLADDIEQAMNEDNSWRLGVTDGEVRWYSGTQSWESEPETDQWERTKSWFLQLLPIEKHL